MGTSLSAPGDVWLLFMSAFKVWRYVADPFTR